MARKPITPSVKIMNGHFRSYHRYYRFLKLQFRLAELHRDDSRMKEVNTALLVTGARISTLKDCIKWARWE